MSVTIHDLAAKVRELAEQNPNYVAPGAGNYLMDAEGNILTDQSCIVGRALHELGFDLRAIRRYEPAYTAAKVYKLIPANPDQKVYDDLFWLGAIQSEQDCHVPWYRAAKNADAWLANDGEAPKYWFDIHESYES